MKKNPHEAELLNLDISKASKILDWNQLGIYKELLKNIIRWHRLWLEGADMKKICRRRDK